MAVCLKDSTTSRWAEAVVIEVSGNRCILGTHAELALKDDGTWADGTVAESDHSKLGIYALSSGLMTFHVVEVGLCVPAPRRKPPCGSCRWT